MAPMFRVMLSCAIIVGLAAIDTFAQGSPPASAKATIGDRNVTIRYSAPSVRGRKIFGPGGLLSRDPTYPAWRAGANAATTLTADGDVEIAGLAVPKGTYSLYVWVQDPEAWQLIVSKETGQSGLTYNAARDLGRVKMTMAKPPALVETLKYTLSDKGGGKGELRLEWEHHVATVPVSTK
jgi:Protein of unknown function (DUF2911)